MDQHVYGKKSDFSAGSSSKWNFLRHFRILYILC